MDYKTEKKDIYQTVTDLVLDGLNKGIIPWLRPWTDATTPYNGATGREYQGINIMILGLIQEMKKYPENAWLTFKQAKDLQGSVKKGEKSTLIVYWSMVKTKDKETKEEKTVPILKYFNVFNISQCENLQGLKTKETKEIKESFENLACEYILSNMPNRPTVNIINSNRAFYQPSIDSITLPLKAQFTTENDFYSTMFHELVHSTGHKSRLARKGVTESVNFGSETYSKEELIAEIGSAMLNCKCNILNDNLLNNSVAYIQNWKRALMDDKKLIVHASGNATKAVKYILNEKEKEEVI